jgi:hypothetical protein
MSTNSTVSPASSWVFSSSAAAAAVLSLAPVALRAFKMASLRASRRFRP